VDLNVKLIDGGTPNFTPFESRGAKNFFGRLPQDVVGSLRANPPVSWGFPSGHTSNAMTLGGLLYLFTKKPWVRLISVAVVVFVPLSRMYLGRHFLADVLGGYVIGLAFVIIFHMGVVKNVWLYSFLSRKPQKLQCDTKVVLFFVYMCALPFVLLILPDINHEVVSALIGLNGGFLLVWRSGIPEDEGTVWQRIARILIALAVYILADLMLERASRLLFHSVTGLILFINNSLTLMFCLWGSTELSIKLNLFQRQSP
jgi:hypothetical protein